MQTKNKMSTPVVVIGYILLVPSVIGVLFSILYLIMAAINMPTVHNHAAGAIATGWGALWLVVWAVSGLLGWLLVMRKRILRCTHCSVVLDA